MNNHSHYSTFAGQYGVPLQSPPEPEPKPEHLRFGHESKAHYEVPLGNKILGASLSRPRELTPKDHVTFEQQVLSELWEKLRKVVDLLLQQNPSLQQEKHVHPHLSVRQPGQYLTMNSKIFSQMLTKEYIDRYRVLFTLGSQRFELIFHSHETDMKTTRRAVNRLLEQILHEFETVESVAMSPERALI